MKIKIWYEEFYLPTKRHRKERVRVLSKDVDIDILQLTENEFPIAIIKKDRESRFEENEEEGVFGIYETEYRFYNGELYRPIRASEYVCRACGWASEKEIKYVIENQKPFHYNLKDEFQEESIITRDTFESELEYAKNRANSFISFGGKIWRVSGEPMYMFLTFGLGYNHGGTGFFIEDFYNPNISHKNYFTAFEKEKAISEAVKVAERRGDTESVDSIRNTKIDIMVLMPEVIKRNPQKDHGNGDEFMNDMEELISGSDSVMEAGFLAIAKTMSEVCK